MPHFGWSLPECARCRRSPSTAPQSVADDISGAGRGNASRPEDRLTCIFKFGQTDQDGMSGTVRVVVSTASPVCDDTLGGVGASLEDDADVVWDLTKVRASF